MGYFSLYLNYFYPKGGTGKLAQVLKDRILALGTNLLKIVKIEGLASKIRTKFEQTKTKMLESRGADILLGHDLDHGGPRHARYVAGAIYRHRHDRQGEIVERDSLRGRRRGGAFGARAAARVRGVAGAAGAGRVPNVDG